jgi:hypothetical protein
MEQRTGRIDRVRSQSDRRLAKLERDSQPEELLQVYFPHLEDTVEVLQVQRVLERMNTFLCLMHEGLTVTDQGDHKINLHREFAGERHTVHQIRTRLSARSSLIPLVGIGGYLALGSTLAYGAGPEIYKEFNAFPGLWIHEQAKKTTGSACQSKRVPMGANGSGKPKSLCKRGALPLS